MVAASRFLNKICHPPLNNKGEDLEILKGYWVWNSKSDGFKGSSHSRVLQYIAVIIATEVANVYQSENIVSIAHCHKGQ